MSTIIKTPSQQHDDSLDARVELLRRAESQDVKPLRSLDELAGDPTLTADFDVDEFLRQVRDDRDRPYNGNYR